jgi:hypothetical protein
MQNPERAYHLECKVQIYVLEKVHANLLSWRRKWRWVVNKYNFEYRSTTTPGVSLHINWCHMLMSLIKIHGDNAQAPHGDNLQMQILNNSHTCRILFCSSYLPGSHVLFVTSTLSDRHCIWSSQHHISQMLKERFAKSASPHQQVLNSILPHHLIHISRRHLVATRGLLHLLHVPKLWKGTVNL